MTTISILGCGWLGAPLARHFKTLGYTVQGSVTSSDKANELKAKGIQPFEFYVRSQAHYPADFFNADILIITLPFKRSFDPPTIYFDQCQSLINSIENSRIQWVLVTSSTMIYPNNDQQAHETDVISPETPRQEVLYDVEQLFITHPGFKTTIIRLGGLYGPNREPGRFFQGKSNIPGGLNQVNMIHLADCIGLIDHIITTSCSDSIINGVSQTHPTKSDFYGTMFAPTRTPHKVVMSRTTYSFKH